MGWKKTADETPEHNQLVIGFWPEHPENPYEFCKFKRYSGDDVGGFWDSSGDDLLVTPEYWTSDIPVPP